MRRLFAAEAIGYGGVSIVSRATGVSRRAIIEGVKELKEPVAQRPMKPLCVIRKRLRRPQFSLIQSGHA